MTSTNGKKLLFFMSLCSIVAASPILGATKNSNQINNEVNMPAKIQDNINAHNPGEAFLAKNKNQPGVVTLASGLQYKIIKQGTGNKPKLTDTVTVHYAGTLIDGKEFDSSYKRGQPASFPLQSVISGWTEALQLMNTGSTWELYIPSHLAYGSAGAPPTIGPNQVLIFKVELLGIK